MRHSGISQTGNSVIWRLSKDNSSTCSCSKRIASSFEHVIVTHYYWVSTVFFIQERLRFPINFSVMIRGQQQKVQLLTARNESDIGKMHRSPLHGLWQENNRAGSPPKAIVIKPIDSVYQKMHCRNAHSKNEHIHQQQMQVRPQSHFLQAVTRGKTPDEKPTPNRKGLFQLELEKNKENLIPNCTPWHVIEG